MLAALKIQHLDGIVVPATGQSTAIGTHPERLDRTLMLLPNRQALPVLHVPPVHAPIAAATDQPCAIRTPDQCVHDRVRLAPGLQALPTLHIPDDELPLPLSALKSSSAV